MNEEEKKSLLGFEGAKEASEEDYVDDETEENDGSPEGDKPVFKNAPMKKFKLKNSKKSRKIINKGVKELKKKTGVLKFFNTNYSNLNNYEKSWVNYWIR